MLTGYHGLSVICLRQPILSIFRIPCNQIPPKLPRSRVRSFPAVANLCSWPTNVLSGCICTNSFQLTMASPLKASANSVCQIPSAGDQVLIDITPFSKCRNRKQFGDSNLLFLVDAIFMAILNITVVVVYQHPVVTLMFEEIL